MRWRDTRWGHATLLPVHDELIVQVPAEDADAATAELDGCMQGGDCKRNGSGAETVVAVSDLCEQDPLSQEREVCSAVHLSFQELDLGVGSLDRPVAVGQGQSRQDCW